MAGKTAAAGRRSPRHPKSGRGRRPAARTRGKWALGNRVIRFIETQCRLPSDDSPNGRPFKLDPWQRRFIRGMFAPGITRACLSVGRKNGKTELAAALILAYLCCSGLAGRHTRIVSVAGAKKDQGKIYERVTAMIDRNPRLKAKLDYLDSRERVVHVERLNVYEVLSSRGRSAHGDIPVFWVYDELAQAVDDRLYVALDTGQGTVGEQGRGLVISTRSEDPNNPMGKLLDSFELLKDGDERLRRHWYWQLHQGVESEDDRVLYSMRNVARANPALGRHLSRRVVRNQIADAIAMPSQRAGFKAYVLNMGLDLFSELVGKGAWQACADPELALERLRGKRLFGGLDLSGSRDLTAFAVYCPETGELIVWCWMPEASVGTREIEDRALYREWARMGRLGLCPGPTIDTSMVLGRIQEVMAVAEIAELRYDRWRVDVLEAVAGELSVTLPPMRKFGQGYADMGPAVDRFERVVAERKLRHDDNPVTNWCFGNCGVQTDPRATSDERKPVKRREHLRIDAVLAALMACAPERVEKGVQDPASLGAVVLT